MFKTFNRGVYPELCRRAPFKPSEFAREESEVFSPADAGEDKCEG